MKTKLKHMEGIKVPITNSDGEKVRVDKSMNFGLPQKKHSKPKMPKSKKVIIWAVSIALVVAILTSVYFIFFWQNTKAYGIEHKILETEIMECVFDDNNDQIKLSLKVKMSLRNKEDYDYNYNLDALYVEISKANVEGQAGKKLNFYFENDKDYICASEFAASNLVVVPANDGVNTLTWSFDLICKNYKLDNIILDNFSTIKLKLKYNDIEVAEFKLEVTDLTEI